MGVVVWGRVQHMLFVRDDLGEVRDCVCERD